jgi:hypothetical protein
MCPGRHEFASEQQNFFSPAFTVGCASFIAVLEALKLATGRDAGIVMPFSPGCLRRLSFPLASNAIERIFVQKMRQGGRAANVGNWGPSTHW